MGTTVVLHVTLTTARTYAPSSGRADACGAEVPVDGLSFACVRVRIVRRSNREAALRVVAQRCVNPEVEALGFARATRSPGRPAWRPNRGVAFLSACRDIRQQRADTPTLDRANLAANAVPSPARGVRHLLDESHDAPVRHAMLDEPNRPTRGPACRRTHGCPHQAPVHLLRHDADGPALGLGSLCSGVFPLVRSLPSRVPAAGSGRCSASSRVSGRRRPRLWSLASVRRQTARCGSPHAAFTKARPSPRGQRRDQVDQTHQPQLAGGGACREVFQPHSATVDSGATNTTSRHHRSSWLKSPVRERV